MPERAAARGDGGRRGRWAASSSRSIPVVIWSAVSNAVAAEVADTQAPVELVTVDDVFGGWDRVREEHLADGAILDQVFVNR